MIPRSLIRGLLTLACLALIVVPATITGNQAVALAQTADTTPPVMWIVSPTDGSTVSGTKVRVNFYAFDLGGFDRYELYVDGVLKQTLLPTAKNMYFVWSPSRNSSGDFTLIVRGYDHAGNIGTSPQITVFR